MTSLAVDGSIVFLAVELQQNNDLLRAEQRESRNQRLPGLHGDVYEGPYIAEILVKARSGQQLSEVERTRLFAYDMRRLQRFEAQHSEYLEGTTEQLPLDQLRRNFHIGGLTGLPLIESWESSKPWLSVEFVQYVEENVIPHPPAE